MVSHEETIDANGNFNADVWTPNIEVESDDHYPEKFDHTWGDGFLEYPEDDPDDSDPDEPISPIWYES